MSLLKRLFGKSVSVERVGSYISLDGDKYRLEQGPAMVTLTFEEGETPQETTDMMKRMMQENGVKLDYLLEMRDVFHRPIKTGVRLQFWQRGLPYIWKLYKRAENGRFIPAVEAKVGVSEAEVIEMAKKLIKEQ